MKMQELKQKIKESKFTMWQVAEAAGVCDVTLARWLRSERYADRQPRIIKALEKLEAGANNG